MRIIYYSTAFYAAHGGQTQSRFFYEEAKKNPLLKEVILFPSKEGRIQSTSVPSTYRSLLKRIPLFQIFFFYRRNQLYLKQIIALIEKEKPDAIILQLDSSFLQIQYLKKKFPALLVTTVVNSSPFDEPFKNILFKSFFKHLERKLLSKSDLNFFVSKALLNRIMNTKGNTARDKVIHNGVDIDFFKPLEDKGAIRYKLGLPTDKIIVGYIGTLDIHKRINQLIEAFAAVSSNHKDLVLLIIGNGPDYAESVALTSRLGLTSKVIFKGWVEHTYIPEYLNAMDMAIHHYAMDYMSPLKLFEYLAVGLPVIAPDIPAVKEILVDGKHVLLTNGSVADIAEKIEVLLSDEELKISITKQGCQYIRTEFTWEKHAAFIISNIHAKHATDQC